MNPTFQPPFPDDQLLLELLQQLDERPCLPFAVLEQAVASALSLAEAADVHAHLWQCVNCLSVFSRLQSLRETDIGVAARPTAQAEFLLGHSPPITALRETVDRLLRWSSEGRRPSPILIVGETGTGKTLLARCLHRASARRDRSFIEFSNAAWPAVLVEAEMFGLARGAFTNAIHPRAGCFELADAGTLVLDEVGVLPPTLQAKLLRVIEDRTVRRVGETRSRSVDVWVIAASSEDLVAATRAQQFREDLYYRLSSVTLWLPPLRERGDDILLLAEHFLDRACRECGSPAKRLDADARSALLAYDWPGNVRQLENVMERVALLSSETVVTASMLALRSGQVEPGVLEERRALAQAAMSERDDRLTADRLTAALRAAGGDLSRAARVLGIPRNTLRYRLKKFGLLPKKNP